MNIDNTLPPSNPAPTERRKGATAASSTTAPARPSPGSPEHNSERSDVNLSAAAREMATLLSTGANEPVVDVGRVARIQEAIRQGAYRTDAGKIADSLLNGVRELLSNNKK